MNYVRLEKKIVNKISHVAPVVANNIGIFNLKNPPFNLIKFDLNSYKEVKYYNDQGNISILKNLIYEFVEQKLNIYNIENAEEIYSVKWNGSPGSPLINGNFIVRERHKGYSNFYLYNIENEVIGTLSSYFPSNVFALEGYLFSNKYLENPTQNLSRLNEENFDVLWTFNFNIYSNTQVGTYTLSNPCGFYWSALENKVVGNRLFFRLGDNKIWVLACLNLENGEMLWISEVLCPMHFEVVNETIFICQWGKVITIDLITGKIKKADSIKLKNLPFNLENHWCKFSIQKDKLFITHYKYLFVAVIDLNSCEIIWYDILTKRGDSYYEIGNPLITENRIYIVDSEGELHAWQKSLDSL